MGRRARGPAALARREGYPVVGDLAETIALILPEPLAMSNETLAHWIGVTKSFAALEEAERRAAIIDAWEQLDRTGRFVFNKLITGGFRLGAAISL